MTQAVFNLACVEPGFQVGKDALKRFFDAFINAFEHWEPEDPGKTKSRLPIRGHVP